MVEAHLEPSVAELSSASQPKVPPVQVRTLFEAQVEVSPPPKKLVEKRLVDEAFVAKKFVVVAEVPVAFRKVKCWSVVEPETRRSP